jgi:hypothetical protein
MLSIGKNMWLEFANDLEKHVSLPSRFLRRKNCERILRGWIEEKEKKIRINAKRFGGC